MTTLPPRALFLDTEMRAMFDRVQAEEGAFITHLASDQALAHNVEDWVRIILGRHPFDVPILRDDITRSESEGDVPSHQIPNAAYRNYGGPTTRGKVYTFHVPYTGDRSLFFMRPGTFPMHTPYAGSNDEELLLSYSGTWLTPETIENDLDKDVGIIKRLLEVLREDVRRFKEQFPQFLAPRLHQRRTAAEKDRTVSAGLKYPLKQRPGAPPAPLAPPPIRLKPKPPALPSIPGADPVLEEAHYKNILQIMQNMSLAMERSPEAFAKMEEEHIRFHFVMQLNGQYEGEAIGEAFNLGGKTDILVRHNGQNLFIAECKFWGGQQTLSDAVDQLYKYVTWRDTKTAVIMFSKNKSYSPVIDEAKKTMRAHPQYISGPIEEGTGRFRYRFCIPSDPQRHITLTLMLFDVHQP